MKISRTLTWFCLLVALLAAFAAGSGLFWQDGGQPFTFTTLRGQEAAIYGMGLYRYDTTLIATGYRIGDAFTLLAGIPLLLVSLWLYRRGSVRGCILLAGTLAYLLYNYSSLALGAAYNNLLLVYIVLTTATLFGLVMAVRSLDWQSLPGCFSERLPRRGIAIFLVVSGLALFAIWLVLSIVPALLAGTVPPELDSYTTVITFLIDMGLIAPTLVAGGALLLQRDPLGYLMAPVLLAFLDPLGLSLLFMGIGQGAAGLISVGQFIGFVVSFAILTFFSLGFTVVLFRNFSETAVGAQHQ